MTYNVNTQKYIDELISALSGVYENEPLPVLEGPSERVLLMYDESKPTFISVIDTNTEYTPADGYELLQSEIELKIEVFVMAAPQAQDDIAVTRARAISDSIVGWLMNRKLQVKTYTGSDTFTVKAADLQPVSRERIEEESIIDGHYSITAMMQTQEKLTC